MPIYTVVYLRSSIGFAEYVVVQHLNRLHMHKAKAHAVFFSGRGIFFSLPLFLPQVVLPWTREKRDSSDVAYVHYIRRVIEMDVVYLRRQ